MDYCLICSEDTACSICARPETHRAHLLPNHEMKLLNNKELNKRVSDELNGGGSGQRNIPVLQLMTRSDPTVMEIFGTCGVF